MNREKFSKSDRNNLLFNRLFANERKINPGYKAYKDQHYTIPKNLSKFIFFVIWLVYLSIS
jgi:hypothetical protein